MTSYPFFFTWTDQRRASPVPLTGGRGAYFETEDGSIIGDDPGVVAAIGEPRDRFPADDGGVIALVMSDEGDAVHGPTA